MSRWVKNSVRFLLVTVGIIALTSFTIDATDMLRGSQSALGILAQKATETGCSRGMVEVPTGDGRFCLDQYENSAGEDCAFADPRSDIDSKKNIAKKTCKSKSVATAKPWTFVTFHQAKELCAKRGGRLPTAREWYEGALGTPVDSTCNLRGQLANTGSREACVSTRGISDAVGNVWEWVDESISNNSYRDRQLPEEGYVLEAGTDGVALVTEDNPSKLFDADYFWTDSSGEFAMLRGGFYGSGEDGGLYSVQAKTAPSFAGSAVGFRCVVDL